MISMIGYTGSVSDIDEYEPQPQVIEVIQPLVRPFFHKSLDVFENSLLTKTSAVLALLISLQVNLVLT